MVSTTRFCNAENWKTGGEMGASQRRSTSISSVICSPHCMTELCFSWSEHNGLADHTTRSADFLCWQNYEALSVAD